MNDSKSREAVLYAFAVEPSHDRETLERYIRQYPALAEDLIDLSYELRLMETLTSAETTAVPDAGWKDAWKQFVASTPLSAKPVRSGNPFAQYKGQAFAGLADSLKIPRSMLAALRDRLVEPSSIPERFIRRFAESTHSSVEAVLGYLSQPPAIISTAQFKADKKPSSPRRVRFEKLIEDSEMTDEQRKILLQDWGDDGLDRG